MDDGFAISSCTAGAQGRFDLAAKPLVDLDGIDPKRRAAFHFKEFRSSVIVPLDFDPVFYGLSDWTGDVDAALRSFAPQTGENGASDTAKRLPGIVRHRKAPSENPGILVNRAERLPDDDPADWTQQGYGSFHCSL
jgi:hypothetical protein